jgi:hypothetical protein
MAKVDPPYRLDPLQMIIRVRWGPVPPEKKGKDKEEESKPNQCTGVIAGFGPIETCRTPGIFGVHPDNFPFITVIGIISTPSILICPIIPPNEFGNSCCASGHWDHGYIIVNPDPLGVCVGIPTDYTLPIGTEPWPTPPPPP